MKIISLFLVISFFIFSSCSDKKVENDYKLFEVSGKVKQVLFRLHTGAITGDASFNSIGQLIYEKDGNRLLEYTYNDDNTLQILNVFNEKKSKEFYRKYVYDDNNLLSRIQEYDSSGNFKREVKYIYDSRGNRSRGDLLSPYKDTLYSWVYTFNENNIMTQEQQIIYKPERSTKEYKHTLDENGNVIAIEEYENGSILWNKKYFEVHNGISLLVLTHNYWAGEVNDSLKYYYNYDEFGNWISRETFQFPGKSYIDERKITYYK